MGDKSSIFYHVNAWTLFFKSIFADISVKLIETIPNWLTLQCADCSDWRTEENFRSNPIILRQTLRRVFLWFLSAFNDVYSDLCEFLFLRTSFVSSVFWGCSLLEGRNPLICFLQKLCGNPSNTSWYISLKTKRFKVMTIYPLQHLYFMTTHTHKNSLGLSETKTQGVPEPAGFSFAGSVNVRTNFHSDSSNVFRDISVSIWILRLSTNWGAVPKPLPRQLHSTSQFN